MLLRLFLFSIGIATVASLDAQPIYQVQPGVSKTLATARKNNLSGIHYKLDLIIPAERTSDIPANERITVTLQDEKYPLQIDFKDSTNKLHELQVNGKPVRINHYNEHIIIDPRFLKKGKNDIDIKFTAGELSLNRKENFLYTLLVPDRARTFFPCFDQPDLKARFTVSLKLPDGWTAITNAPLQSKGPKLQYATSDLIPTYLFSIAAGKFFEKSNIVAGRKMNFIYRETDSAKLKASMDSIFHLHGRSLRFLEDYTQIKYPFKKFDFAAIPDFQYGGMEHVGAIDYRSSTLFLDSAATQNQKNSRSSLIAHETAHMWFGDLVTMKWFNDVWMKEVFANFMADKINRDPAAKTAYELRFLTSHFPSAYSIDRTKGANSIRQPLENLNEAGTLYGPIIYNKAPIMMQQLEMLMGERAFKSGVREYLKKYANSNADWPQLVGILDRYTPADLKSWNEVWVNRPGRPVFTYDTSISTTNEFRIGISQRSENGDMAIWPQIFDVAFVYPNKIKRFLVRSTGYNDITTKSAERPLAILLNSEGKGYGLYQVDSNMLNHADRLRDPVMRASLYVSLYENMLAGKTITPSALLGWFTSAVEKETEELNVSLLLDYANTIYWRFLKQDTRRFMAANYETKLWKAMEAATSPNKKKLLFRSFQGIALGQPALDTIYSIWKNKTPPAGITLNEDDYTSMAVNLVLKGHSDLSVIEEQISRLTNPDRKERLRFMIPALSPNEATRDSFFHSLKELSVRKNESRVEEALGYLHHPLRTASSIKYLKESLEMLETIQKTGDIFFPAAWLNASFRGHQSAEALQIVNDFLNARPAYNSQLKMKILQATDMLNRAVRIAE